MLLLSVLSMPVFFPEGSRVKGWEVSGSGASELKALYHNSIHHLLFVKPPPRPIKSGRISACMHSCGVMLRVRNPNL